MSALGLSSDDREGGISSAPASVFERLSFILLLLVLAWAPFPLGSNRPWAWSLLSLLIAASWLSWCISLWRRRGPPDALVRKLAIPLILAAVALIWGVAQVLPFLPQSWAHPVWRTASAALGLPLKGTISLAPWRTISELMKLVSYVMVLWLASRFARSWPDILLNALIGIGTCYIVYGFVLASLNQSQFAIFYGLDARSEVRNLAGPFVNHNSYATYAGLIALCAGVRLVGVGWGEFAVAAGPRRLILAGLHYVFGQGGLWLAAALLALSTVIATGSRGGNFATFSAIGVLVLLSTRLAFRQARGGYALGIIFALCAGLVVLFAISGALLGARLDDMAALGLKDNTRLLLWNAALGMIHDAPLGGLGLGTYQIAYPSYAHATLPFIMDKAHNDYVELAAGWGLPAAILWWASLGWLFVICLRGVLVRKRNRVFPMLAVGASVLVGVHAMFDFSLQMPAIAVTFAAILGLGVAQAFPPRELEPAGRQHDDGARSSKRSRLFSAALVLPFLVLVAVAIPRLASGEALEETSLAGLQISANAPMTPAAYSQTAEILARAPAGDGDTQILRAEAAMDAGQPSGSIIPIAKAALARSPGSARGWIILAALLSDRDPEHAAHDLSLAFALAPIDYYLILPRTFAGAGLWQYLPPGIQARLLKDTRRLAMDKERRSDLRALLDKRGGPELVTRAFAGQPEILRGLNRDLALETLHL